MEKEGRKEPKNTASSSKKHSKKSKRSSKSKSKSQKVGTSKKSGSSSKETTIEDFKILNMLGNGAQGNVYLVEKVKGIDEGNVYALKVYDKSIISEDEVSLDCLTKERKILEKIQDDPFLATMIYAFQNASSMYIVMEFAQGGEIFQLLKEHTLSTVQARFYIAEIIVAIELLHKKNILYRDLKLENILLDAQGHVLLTDFGLSVDFNEKIPEGDERLAGTANYLSPESIDYSLPYGLSSDWWSVGILAHELLSSTSPFEDGNEDKNVLYQKIKNEPPLLSEEIEGAPLDFIINLLQKNANDRLGSKYGAQELKNHSWFEGIDWNLMAHKAYPAPITHKFVDKYDVCQFDEDFTNASLDLVKNSAKKRQQGIEDFSFITPSLTEKKPKKMSTRIAMSKEQKQNLNLIFNEHARMIGKKMPKLYVDNKYRPSMIEAKIFYKKEEKL